MPKRVRDHDSTVSKVASKKISKNGATHDWRAVEGTEFLEGLDEDGFMGLEELDAPKMFSSSSTAIAQPETVSPVDPAVSKRVPGSDAAKPAIRAKTKRRTSAAISESKKAAAPKVTPQESCDSDSKAPKASGISAEAAEGVKEGFHRFQERIQAEKLVRNEVSCLCLAVSRHQSAMFFSHHHSPSLF